MVDGADGKLFEDETEEDIWIGIGFDDDNDDVNDLLFVVGGGGVSVGEDGIFIDDVDILDDIDDDVILDELDEFDDEISIGDDEISIGDVILDVNVGGLVFIGRIDNLRGRLLDDVLVWLDGI